MSKQHICANCGFTGPAKKITKGSFMLELFLWFCFLLPGLIYSIWRLSSRYPACMKCGSQHLVPLDSPRADALQRELGLKGMGLTGRQ